ncbi:MAG: small conductance mechanosensitive channel [Bacteroidia bacterium]|jgi:small conductance mechanosensitive channel
MEIIAGTKGNFKILAITIGIIVITMIVTRVVRWSMNRSFLAASKKLKVDATRYRFFKHAATMMIWLVSFGVIISFIPALKAFAITLFAGAGILMALIGFAAQEAFSNIVSGVFIVMFRPFRVGDMIKVGSLQYGVVEDITLRHTVINSFENKRIIIPNSVISTDVIVNDSIGDEKICKWIEIGISYDSDVDLAIRIIQEESEKHPLSMDNRTTEMIQDDEPIVEVWLIELDEYSVNLRAYVWTSDALLAPKMRTDINKSVKHRFDKEGVEIPFPYRTVVYKKDLPANS